MRHVKESRENKETISLAAGLSQSENSGQVFQRIREHYARTHRLFVNLYGNVALKGICLYSET